mmetsp:Transcript_123/g.229  ORF Transcript_123/g.229 Transcript_123/m.229 type:complete len:197 (+) Transcript_123:1255-1845(+)
MAKLAFEWYDNRKSLVVQEFYQQTIETERSRFKELEAAVKIQALFRMHRQRKMFLELKSAVRIIKRVYRGYRTRLNFWSLVNAAVTHQRKMFYSSAASTVQRVYRGWYSRKYFHDFKARKRYLMKIEEQNQKIISQLGEYRFNLEVDEQKRNEDYARMEFHKLASSLHHLSSTKNIPGVYKALEEVSDFGRHSLKT